MTSDAAEKKVENAPATLPDAGGEHEHDLQRLDRLANLGLFAASIAHEIKNGLVAVHTFVETLLEKGQDRELAEVVRRELKRIDALASQMLRFASPKPRTLAPVNIHALLDHSLRLLEYQIKNRMVVLRRDYHAAPEMVNGDEWHLQQVFMNLLLNAVEAMGNGGELTVATETTAGRVRISVGDTGAGIAPENLPHVFETFYTTKKHGTGLGLAISKRIVEEHRGTIEVQSKVGRGATFIIMLPAA